MIYLYLFIAAAVYFVVMLLFWRFVKEPEAKRGFLISRIAMAGMIIAAVTVFNVFGLPNKALGYVLIGVLVLTYSIEHGINSKPDGNTDEEEKKIFRQ